MNSLFNLRSVRTPAFILSLALLISACGGGGGSADNGPAIVPPVPTSSTGTVVILLTDAPDRLLVHAGISKIQSQADTASRPREDCHTTR